MRFNTVIGHSCEEWSLLQKTFKFAAFAVIWGRWSNGGNLVFRFRVALG